MSNEINLLKTTNTDKTQVFAYQGELRKLGFLILVIVLSCGILVLLTSAVLSITKSSYLNTQKTLLRQLEFEKSKENTYLVIKNRISIVEKALGLRVPMGEILGYVFDIVMPPKLVSMDYDEQNVMLVRMEPESIEDTMEILAKYLILVKQEHMSEPVIDSFSISERGISLALSFKPEWK